MVRSPTPFTSFVCTPPARHFVERTKTESVIDFVWHSFRMYRDLPDQGRALFSGTKREKNEAWGEYRGFVRQAEAYFDAARQVSGSSAALLYYYCVLNLAKAALLRSNRAEVMGGNVKHGLSTPRPSVTPGIAGDEVIVRQGVFPLLYRRLTGQTIAQNTRLPVKRLLVNVPEIGSELGDLGYRPQAVGVLHAVVDDGKKCWSILAIDADWPVFVGSNSTMRSLRSSFDEVSAPNNAHRVFNLSSHFPPGAFRFLEEETLLNFQERDPTP